MKDVNGEIQYKDKIYKTVFNLNVMEAIQEEYGTLDNMSESQTSKHLFSVTQQ